MIRLRHTDEWVGLVVLAAVLVFLGVALQAGVLRDWFRPVVTLRILLPESGVAGLSAGSEVEVLGTRAGTIRRVVIDPNRQMYAEAEIDEQVTAFIRRDSEAVIRRRFGVAGAAYVDITRGSGAELDWDFAVIQAETERAPTETVGALIDEVRARILPVLADAGRAMQSLAVTMERIEKGEGSIGRLLTDDTIAREAEGTVAQAHAATADLGRILERLDGVASDAAGIADNVESATSNLPSLLTQAQQTVYQLDQFIVQLRGLWILGGADAAPAEAGRLPPTEVQP